MNSVLDILRLILLENGLWRCQQGSFYDWWFWGYREIFALDLLYYFSWLVFSNICTLYIYCTNMIIPKKSCFYHTNFKTVLPLVDQLLYIISEWSMKTKLIVVDAEVVPPIFTTWLLLLSIFWKYWLRIKSPPYKNRGGRHFFSYSKLCFLLLVMNF